MENLINFAAQRSARRPDERPLYSASQLASYNAASVAADRRGRRLTMLETATALYGPTCASELSILCPYQRLGRLGA
jgi:hypothetical protein